MVTRDFGTDHARLSFLLGSFARIFVVCASGWWYTYPSEKYEFVSWDYYYQYMEK